MTNGADDEIDGAGFQPGIGEREPGRLASQVDLRFGLADKALDHAGGGFELALPEAELFLQRKRRHAFGRHRPAGSDDPDPHSQPAE